MYKLFLCLRYLRRRVIAYFAVLAVALCVAMMLIVASVMNGFLAKMENAAKGLYGDIMVRPPGIGGLPYYDEFIDFVADEVPEVKASSPYIHTFGILQLHGSHVLRRVDFRQTVQIAGIRLPERTAVTDFESGLWAQAGDLGATFDPSFERLRKIVTEHSKFTAGLLNEIKDQGDDEAQLLRGRIWEALRAQRSAASALGDAAKYQEQMTELAATIRAETKRLGGKAAKDPDLAKLHGQMDALVALSKVEAPADRLILGLGIPWMSFRTEEGRTVRRVLPGHRVVLSMIPLSEAGATSAVEPVTNTFTVVDDCRTDVAPIDSSVVYVPFETLQRLNDMDAEYNPERTKIVEPARCSMIHIKVKDEFAQNERQLREVAAKIRGAWAKFIRKHPTWETPDVSIETWRQIQAKFIAPIEQQRTLVIVMFGVISLTAVVLIFVIFYTIVVQKTRDIGVLKSVGGSSSGVATIFLSYGGAVGLAGAIIGVIIGYYFVHYINAIHDALGRWFGFQVWSKEVFLFEKIPNEVEWTTAIWIAVGAIISGLVGALLPALRAARMQPVEALRYE